MTPDRLSKSGTEAAHQIALFAWAAVAHNHGLDVAWLWANSVSGTLQKPPSNPVETKCLKWLHAIPNGGSRGDNATSRAIRGSQLKAQGVKAGVPDVFLPVPKGGYNGLYIEMKKPLEKPKKETSKGGLSDEQIEFKEFAKLNRYAWIVCYSWREAAEAITGYLKMQDKAVQADWSQRYRSSLRSDLK